MNSKRMVKFLPLIFLTLLGCSQIESGEIIDKDFVPAHSYLSATYNPLTDQIETETVEVDDAWYITIQKKDEDGQLRQRKVGISESSYDSLKLGEWYMVK